VLLTRLFATAVRVASDLVEVESPDRVELVAQLEQLAVASGPIDSNVLTEELELRLPHVEIVAAGVPTAPRPVALRAHLELRGSADVDAVDLTLVTSDGRAYDRRIPFEGETDPRERTRVVARTLANLVFAIQQGKVTADRENVELPQPQSPPCPVVSEPSVVAPPEPPAAVCAPTPPQAPASTVAPVRRTELGLRGGIVAGLGLGPPSDVDRFLGWGGELDLRVRTPKGLLVTLAVRGLQRGHDAAVRLMRWRIAAGVGYVFRPMGDAPFELEASASVFVEPWSVLGAALPSVPPLVGGLARCGLGYRWRGRAVSGRAGLYAGLGLGGVPRGAAVAKVSLAEGDATEALFRVGGAELEGGIEGVVWFALPRRSPP